MILDGTYRLDRDDPDVTLGNMNDDIDCDGIINSDDDDADGDGTPEFDTDGTTLTRL